MGTHIALGYFRVCPVSKPSSMVISPSMALQFFLGRHAVGIALGTRLYVFCGMGTLVSSHSSLYTLFFLLLILAWFFKMLSKWTTFGSRMALEESIPEQRR